MINHETVERQRGDNDWLWVADVEPHESSYIHIPKEGSRKG